MQELSLEPSLNLGSVPGSAARTRRMGLDAALTTSIDSVMTKGPQCWLNIDTRDESRAVSYRKMALSRARTARICLLSTQRQQNVGALLCSIIASLSSSQNSIRLPCSTLERLSTFKIVISPESSAPITVSLHKPDMSLNLVRSFFV